MKKTKNWLINYKKIVIGILFSIIVLIGIVAIIWVSNSKSVVNIENSTEKTEVQNNELDQKINDTKKMLEEKLKIVDKISDEDKNKLENIKKNLSEAISKKDATKINEFQNELQKIVIVESIKKEENTISNEATGDISKQQEANENVITTTEKVTETKPAVKPTTQPITTPKVEEKKKTCRIVRTLAKYKTVHHSEKFRMEPIMEQRNASCVFMPDGSEVDITGWDFPKVRAFKEKHRVGRTGTCTNLPNVKVGEIKIVEQEAWTEEVEISPAKEGTICE